MGKPTLISRTCEFPILGALVVFFAFAQNSDRALRKQKVEALISLCASGGVWSGSELYVYVPHKRTLLSLKTRYDSHLTTMVLRHETRRLIRLRVMRGSRKFARGGLTRTTFVCVCVFLFVFFFFFFFFF